MRDPLGEFQTITSSEPLTTAGVAAVLAECHGSASDAPELVEIEISTPDRGLMVAACSIVGRRPSVLVAGARHGASTEACWRLLERPEYAFETVQLSSPSLEWSVHANAPGKGPYSLSYRLAHDDPDDVYNPYDAASEQRFLDHVVYDMPGVRPDSIKVDDDDGHHDVEAVIDSLDGVRSAEVFADHVVGGSDAVAFGICFSGASVTNETLREASADLDPVGTDYLDWLEMPRHFSVRARRGGSALTRFARAQELLDRIAQDARAHVWIRVNDLRMGRAGGSRMAADVTLELERQQWVLRCFHRGPVRPRQLDACRRHLERAAGCATRVSRVRRGELQRLHDSVRRAFGPTAGLGA